MFDFKVQTKTWSFKIQISDIGIHQKKMNPKSNPNPNFKQYNDPNPNPKSNPNPNFKQYQL